MKQLPNAITLLNLFAGCLATVAAFSGHPDHAAMLVVICALLDFLDGTASRYLKAGSELGKQLDSLADLISFGMAPAAIMFHYLQTSHGMTVFNTSTASKLPYLAFLITLFSALRLARFNIDDQQKTSFIGLPTPANALFFAAIPLVISFSVKQGWIYKILIDLTQNSIVMLALIVFFSILLIAPLSMFSLKFRSLKFSDNKLSYIYISMMAVFFLIMGWESLVLMIPLYILLSVLSSISGYIR